MIHLPGRVRTLVFTLATSCFGFSIAASQQIPSRRAVPAFRLGGADAPEAYTFAETPQLVVDPAGYLFARSASEGRVSLFSPDGKFVRTFGRHGDGPGEFRIAADHGLLGDTLWIRNWTIPKISLFLRNGTHLATVRTPFSRFAGTFGAPTGITGYLQDGKAFAFPTEMPTGRKGRVKLSVFVGDREMKTADTVITVVEPSGMYIPGVGVWAYDPIPANPLVAVSSNGAAIAIAEWVPEVPSIVQIRLLSPAGKQRWVRRLSFQETLVPASVRDSLVAMGVSKASPQLDRMRRRGEGLAGSNRTLVEEALNLPRHFPPIRQLIVGVDGTVWLERMVSMRRGLWHVLAPNGSDLFQIELPPKFQVHQSSATSVWGIELDEFDVASIVRFQLVDR